MQTPCRGQLGGIDAGAPNATHDLQDNCAGYLFCRVCGVWGRERRALLNAPCAKGIRSFFHRFALERLEAGLPPLPDTYKGRGQERELDESSDGLEITGGPEDELSH